ncbi:unnamed protein product [Thlaspi arvense]|uniref:Uncharacterized protein n=1 Tax=Thlaspi arvense TaxID=13288 RepID=A0AAU9T7N5_THLAR|nr:unnamed protein product [Thlaspi arvense]
MSNSDQVMFSVSPGGYWVKNHVGDVCYIAGYVITFECNPEDFFTVFANEMGEGNIYYGHQMWYKLPLEDNKERKRLNGGESSFQRMCEAGKEMSGYRVVAGFLQGWTFGLGYGVAC